ncbi:MAG: hypothetical protein FJ087_10400 [Deltaproteobacteria bacterium]|nr:hypothetical protein [Deltaproteobacteria bacterium]
MLRRIAPLLAAAAALAAVVAAPAPAAADPYVDQLYSKPGFVGLLLRPVVCIDNCDRTVFSFGAEAGYKFVALAARYGYAGGTHYVYPDVRFYWDFQVVRNLTVTPLLEFSPEIAKGDQGSTISLFFRPGVRVGYAPAPYFMLFMEPLLFDLGFYHRTSPKAGPDVTSKELTFRYEFGFGIQARF